MKGVWNKKFFRESKIPPHTAARFKRPAVFFYKNRTYAYPHTIVISVRFAHF